MYKFKSQLGPTEVLCQSDILTMRQMDLIQYLKIIWQSNIDEGQNMELNRKCEDHEFLI